MIPLVLSVAWVICADDLQVLQGAHGGSDLDSFRRLYEDPKLRSAGHHGLAKQELSALRRSATLGPAVRALVDPPPLQTRRGQRPKPSRYAIQSSCLTVLRFRLAVQG